MSDIKVLIGRPTEIVQLDYRKDAETLVEDFRAQGLDAELEVIENTGGRGVVLVEWLQMVLLGGLGTAGATAVTLGTTDLYKIAKRWARRRYARKRAESEFGGSRPVGFILSDLEGREIARWSTLEDKGKSAADLEDEKDEHD